MMRCFNSRGDAETRRGIASGEAAETNPGFVTRNALNDLTGLRPAQLLRASASPRESFEPGKFAGAAA